MPLDSMMHFKKSEYLQLDMQVSVLQSKLSRAERLLEEFERKEAANSKSFSIIAKQLNRLSNSSKKHLVKTLTIEIGGYLNNGKDNGFSELVTCLTTFISNIKVISDQISAHKSPPKSQSAKSQGYEHQPHNKLKELIVTNTKLKNRLNNILRTKLLCKNCNTQIDIAKAVSSTKESIGTSNRLATSSDLGFPGTNDRFKSFDMSKFSVLKSLKSLLNGESSIIPEYSDAKNEKEIPKPNFLNESSLFIKKPDPVKDIDSNRAALNTPNNSYTKKEEHLIGRQDESSQYDYRVTSYGSQKPTESKIIHRDLLKDFNCPETLNGDQVSILYHLDTIKSISSKKSEDESPKKNFKDKVSKCLDNLQRQVDTIQQEVFTQVNSLKQIVSAREEYNKDPIQGERSVESFKSSDNRKELSNTSYSGQTPYFDRIAVNDIRGEQNKAEFTYNHTYIENIDDIGDYEYNEVNGHNELRKSKSLDPRITEKLINDHSLKLEAVFRYNQPKPNQYVNENSGEMFESFKFFNPQSNRTQKTQNVFETDISDKKIPKPKISLAFAKTTNEGFFKTMRYDRNKINKTLANNERTKTSANNNTVGLKDFRNINVPKIAKQIISQLSTANPNKQTKPLKNRSPEQVNDQLTNRSRRANNELIKTFNDSIRPKTRLQNQNSLNYENMTSKGQDSQRSLLNKIKGRIVAKASLTPRSHLGNINKPN